MGNMYISLLDKKPKPQSNGAFLVNGHDGLVSYSLKAIISSVTISTVNTQPTKNKNNIVKLADILSDFLDLPALNNITDMPRGNSTAIDIAKNFVNNSVILLYFGYY
jgi:hypothetical protein